MKLTRNEVRYAVMVFIVSAILSIAFAVWTVYIMPNDQTNYDAVPGYSFNKGITGGTNDIHDNNP